MILIIDTTKKTGRIILMTNKSICIEQISANEKHSEVLLSVVDKVLENNNISLKDLDCFGVVVGPGSFTGIRVGLATIKAFNMAYNKKTIALNVFDIVSNKVVSGSAILSATNSTSYFAIYKECQIIECGVIENNDIESKLNNIYCLDEQKELYCSYSKVKVIDNYPNLMQESFYKNYINKNFTDSNKIEPFYIQLSQAERLKNDKSE